MKKLLLFFLMGMMTVLAYSAENGDIQVTKSLEDSITKDYDQDGKYSAYEKALRRAQESIYVALPEKKGYWYTMLEKIKIEEAELYTDIEARMKKK